MTTRQCLSSIVALCAAAFVLTSELKAQQPQVRVAIDVDDIGGRVTSVNGPEAGVWVIAETSDFSVKFRKIVVTDDQGRFVLPDLPRATYQVWVRGYGLVDSKPVSSALGRQLALTAVVAPDAHAAAQIYPASYWMSLMQLPGKDKFPMQVAAPATAPGARGVGGLAAVATPRVIESQEQWVNTVKGCIVCHQMGTKATRELSPALGTFNSSIDAWERRLRSGQTGANMYRTVTGMGSREIGLGFYADWTDRIAKGEIPEAPPRPQGLERNVVISSWDIGEGNSFVHESGSTDKRNPRVNAYGSVYGVDWHNNSIVVLDPLEHRQESIPLPTKEPASVVGTMTSQTIDLPSPYWGEEIVMHDIGGPDTPMVDSHGLVWTANRVRRPPNPEYCYDGSNAFSKHWPLRNNFREATYYDPKTKTMHIVDTCFPTHHLNFGYDKDDTLYFHGPQVDGGPPILGWIKTKPLLAGGSEVSSQGWCPAFLDTNGDGKIDPKTDKPISGGLYAVSQSPADVEAGIIWASAPGGGTPGKIIRYSLGKNPPETCVAEFYEPPYNNAALPGVKAWLPRGLDVDTNGIVWTSLAGSSDFASFDRRKCKVLSGPPAETGQHCPEGWTLYPQPGPTFKGAISKTTTEWSYLRLGRLVQHLRHGTECPYRQWHELRLSDGARPGHR